jgi:hypothetical protein
MQQFFPHRNIHKETWTFPDGTTGNQIDHIHVTDILYVMSYSGAHCNTGHFLVIAKIRQRIMAMEQKMGEKTELYNVDSLKDGVEVKLKYREGISKDLQESEPSSSSAEECWERIKTSVTKNAEEVIGVRPKQETNNWYDEECQRNIEDRNNARLKMLRQTKRESMDEFKEKRRVASDTCKKEKRKWKN